MHDGSVATSLTLLARLQTPRDEEAWARFVRLYTPLLVAWARRAGCTGQQADDLLQEVFLSLLQKLHTFSHRSVDGSFRRWLRAVTRNKFSELRRGKWQSVVPNGEVLDTLPAGPDPDPFEKQEFRGYVLRRSLELAKTDFTEGTWRAFQEHAMNGRSAEDVARELGVSENVVTQAKSRVLKRLREEIAGQIE